MSPTPAPQSDSIHDRHRCRGRLGRWTDFTGAEELRGKILEQISTESRELIERARTKRLQPQEYAGATFSISNLGMYDVDNFIAVLMPPQATCIAVSAVRDVAVVENGTIRAGRRMSITLSCDHRALDGMQAAQFLKEFKRILEHPQELAKQGTTS